MDIFKILGLIFITTVICIILKQHKPEYALLISVCGGIIILTFLFKKVLVPITVIAQKIESYGIENSYFKVALKALGIGYITSFISDTCKDAGQQALASKAMLVGKCAIFLLAVPLILTVLETALGFIK